MRIGWLADSLPFMGGAEYEAAELRRTAPDGVEIVDCSPDHMHADVDAYVVHNCGTYRRHDGIGRDVIAMLSQKPVIKRVHDVAMTAPPELRSWLIRNAKVMLCSSLLHVEAINWEGVQRSVEIIPSAINAVPFQTVMPPVKRVGTVWLGRIYASKGIEAAAEWARMNHAEVDVYGFGPMQDELPSPLRYCGPLPQARVAEVLMQYERFLFLPTAPEPFGRTVIEAWLAGCELVVNANVGALWWIQRSAHEVTDGAAKFWGHVMEAVK